MVAAQAGIGRLFIHDPASLSIARTRGFSAARHPCRRGKSEIGQLYPWRRSSLTMATQARQPAPATEKAPLDKRAGLFITARRLNTRSGTDNAKTSRSRRHSSGSPNTAGSRTCRWERSGPNDLGETTARNRRRRRQCSRTPPMYRDPEQRERRLRRPQRRPKREHRQEQLLQHAFQASPQG